MAPKPIDCIFRSTSFDHSLSQLSIIWVLVTTTHSRHICYYTPLPEIPILIHIAHIFTISFHLSELCCLSALLVNIATLYTQDPSVCSQYILPVYVTTAHDPSKTASALCGYSFPSKRIITVYDHCAFFQVSVYRVTYRSQSGIHSFLVLSMSSVHSLWQLSFNWYYCWSELIETKTNRALKAETKSLLYVAVKCWHLSCSCTYKGPGIFRFHFTSTRDYRLQVRTFVFVFDSTFFWSSFHFFFFFFDLFNQVLLACTLADLFVNGSLCWRFWCNGFDCFVVFLSKFAVYRLCFLCLFVCLFVFWLQDSWWIASVSLMELCSLSAMII